VYKLHNLNYTYDQNGTQFLNVMIHPFFQGLHKLVVTWTNCISKDGDCVEKQYDLL